MVKTILNGNHKHNPMVETMGCGGIETIDCDLIFS
jgi:hypothetical protein